MKKKQVFLTHNDQVTQGHVKLYPYSLSVSFFILDGLLIDTGCLSHKRVLLDYFRSNPLQQVVLTHHHEDHSGNAHFLEQEDGLPIYMCQKTKEIMNNPPKIPFYRRVTWGQMQVVQGKLIGKTIETNRYCLEVIDTPGHCEDHISLLERNEGMLFSGDLFVSPKIKYSLKGESFRSTLSSIDKLLTYDFDTIYCAHAGFVPDGHRQFKRKKEYLLHLIGEIMHQYEQGHSMEEMQHWLHPHFDWKHWFSRGDFSSYQLIRRIIEEYAQQPPSSYTAPLRPKV